MSSRRKFCCSELLRDLSSCGLVLSKKTLVTMQGNMVHGCYYPLPRRKLEWQISISDVPKQVEKEQAKLMQARLSLSNEIVASVNVSSNSHCSLYRKLN